MGHCMFCDASALMSLRQVVLHCPHLASKVSICLSFIFPIYYIFSVQSPTEKEKGNHIQAVGYNQT